MIRYLTPVVFLAAAAYVRWYDASHTASVLMLPFVTSLDGYKDPVAAGDLSWKIIAGIGVFLLGLTLVEDIRRRRGKDAEPPPAP